MTKEVFNYKDCGINIFTPNGNKMWCFPFISQVFGDIPEQSSIMLTYNSMNCKNPCNTCLVSCDDLNNINLRDEDICIRTPAQMQDAIKNGYAFDVALVQWYDFRYKSTNRLTKYGCPLVQLLNDFNFIPVESIIELIHVIPRYDKHNEYFINHFMF